MEGTGVRRPAGDGGAAEGTTGQEADSVLALLTDEQVMLGDMARDLGRKLGLANPSDLEGADPGACWQELARAGLLGFRVRDESGRPAASGVEVAVVSEAMGAALVPVAYVISGVLVPELLAIAGAPDQLQNDVAEGRAIIGLAMRADLTGVASAAELSDAVLVGTPGYRAVLALGAGSGELVSVAADEQNLERLDGAELSLPLYRWRETSDLAPVSVGHQPSQDDMDRWLALGLSALSAEMTGAAEAGLRGAIEYSKNREAFGVPIGTFQALQHMAADAYVYCEGLRSTNSHAAWSVDEEPAADALLAARVTKAYAARQMVSVTETVMQMYGGIGNTWEHIAHFYARRVLLDRYLLGDTQLQLAAIADRRLARLSASAQ
jgi:alkylation response protein AidB-like acyl-CoA dehydrogenase